MLQLKYHTGTTQRHSKHSLTDDVDLLFAKYMLEFGPTHDPTLSVCVFHALTSLLLLPHSLAGMAETVVDELNGSLEDGNIGAVVDSHGSVRR